MSVHPNFHFPPVASFRVEATTLYHVVVGKEGAEPTRGLLVARETKDGSRMKHRLACWRSRGAFAGWAQCWAMLGMLLLGLESVGLHAATYERKVELPPIALDATKLKEILDVTAEYLARVNTQNPSDKKPIVMVYLRNESTGEAWSSESLSVPTGRIPFSASVLGIQHRDFSGTISWVDINLSDYKRSIWVSGGNDLEVQNCIGFLERELSRERIWFGGFSHRYGLTLVLLGILQGASMVMPRHGRFASIQKLKPYLSLMTTALFLCAVVLPWERVFPGFAFHQTEPIWLLRLFPPFLVKLGEMVASVAAIIGIPIACWKTWRWLTRRENQPNVS